LIFDHFLSEAPITFLTVATRDYEDYVGPFVASALSVYTTACCDVWVDDADRFLFANADLMEALDVHFPGRVYINTIPESYREVRPGSLRWLLVPCGQRDYTCCVDVDHIVLSPRICQECASGMAVTGLPYHNRIRRGQRRFYGTHIYRTRDWFRVFSPKRRLEWAAAQNRYLDEELLFAICEHYFGLPPLIGPKVPYVGLHCSSRWEGRQEAPPSFRHQEAGALFSRLRRLKGWRGCIPHFAHWYRENILRTVETYFDEGLWMQRDWDRAGDPNDP
jgi:hypothetical protein